MKTRVKTGNTKPSYKGLTKVKPNPGVEKNKGGGAKPNPMGEQFSPRADFTFPGMKA